VTVCGAGRAELLQLLPRECADGHTDRRPHGAARGFFLPSVYLPLSALTLISSVVACAAPELGSQWRPPTADEDDGWIWLREGNQRGRRCRAHAQQHGGKGEASPAGHKAGAGRCRSGTMQGREGPVKCARSNFLWINRRWTLVGKKRNTWGYLQN
jgi:hypothetical protein